MKVLKYTSHITRQLKLNIALRYKHRDKIIRLSLERKIVGLSFL